MAEITKLILVSGYYTKVNTIFTELHWCLFDISKKACVSECDNTIRPDDPNESDPEIIALKNNLSKLEISSSCEEVITQFNNFCNLFTPTNTGVMFYCYALRDAIVDKMKNYNIVPSSLIYYKVNFQEQFKKFYKIDDSVFGPISSPNYKNILSQLNLKPIQSITQAKTTLQNMLRLSNKATKDGFKVFFFEKIDFDKNDKTNYLDFCKKEKDYFLKVIGLPLEYISKLHNDLLDDCHVTESDISVIYNIYGKYNDEIIIKISGNADFYELAIILK